MKQSSFFIFLLMSMSVLAQDLYIGNNSFLYARDVPLFVNNDIRMETATSLLYLRGDAQLVQNNDIKNSDLGSLSVYQDQTTGIYEYNYWASPVGVGVNTTANANASFLAGTNIFDPANHTDLTNVTSSPYGFTTAYNGTPTQLSSFWLYTFVDGEGYSDWVHVGNTNNVDTGYGFTMKGSPNAANTLDFRGRPNTGNINVSVNYDGVDNDTNSDPINTAETLVGNPYPSALDLKLFLIDGHSVVGGNDDVLTGTAYFWEQVNNGSHFLADYEGGYATYVPGDPLNLADNGTYTVATFENYDGFGGVIGATSGSSPDYTANSARRYAAIGQGFMVRADGAGGNAIFHNGMRLYLPEDSTPSGAGSIFGKLNSDGEEVIAMSHNGVDYMNILNNPITIPEIRIHTYINNTYYRENIIAFRAMASLDYTKFCDGEIATALENDTYMSASGKRLVIKSIDYNENHQIPFVIKAEAGNTNTFSTEIYSMDNVPDSVNVYVYDTENGTYTDIKNGSFNITLPQGTYENRFKITFTQQTLDVEEISSTNFTVFQNNPLAQLTVKNPNQYEVSQIALYDIAGKQIFNEVNLPLETTYTFSTKNLSEGAYVVKITLANKQVIDKKIVIAQQ